MTTGDTMRTDPNGKPMARDDAWHGNFWPVGVK